MYVGQSSEHFFSGGRDWQEEGGIKGWERHYAELTKG